jgi:hypothetical protein
VTSFSPSEWGVVCDEVRDALDDPAIETKIRAWARSWVDTFIEYVKNRPAA